jgi:hypothetical protein
MLGIGMSLDAAELRDYLIQKVCVDTGGTVLIADPWRPPAGATLRNLAIGEKLPYFKHDQPMPGLPSGYQRHDSYPALDAAGNEIIINPFHYGDHPGNGVDIYRVMDDWTSGAETQDGGGFWTTFFGTVNGAVRPFNGWVFFSQNLLNSPTRTFTVKAPIAGRYWEQNGEYWPGTTPTSLGTDSETTFRIVKNCPFGGMNGNPVKTMDAIKVVHGYQSAVPQGNQVLHDQFMQKGHLEVFYFTQPYGSTRWEAWVLLRTLGDCGEPSEPLAKALQTAVRCLPTVDQNFIYPSKLSHQAMNKIITATHQGEDGQKHTYALIDARDWTGITLMDSPELPPPCPVACQNLLKNFHFNAAGFSPPWHRFGTSKEGHLINWCLAQSKATLDVRYNQNGSTGGVCYLMTNTGGTPNPDQQAIYQDIPVSGLQSGMYTISARVRSQTETGIMKLALQQFDSDGGRTVEIVAVRDVGQKHQSSGPTYTYSGPTDNSANASVVLSSSLIAARGLVTLRPNATFLRLLLLPQTSNTFDVVDVNVSRTGPITCKF